MDRRDTWKLRNVSTRQLSIGDLRKVPTLSPNRSCDLLDYYTKEEVLASRNLLTIINLGWCTLTKYEDDENTVVDESNSTEALTVAFKNDLLGGVFADNAAAVTGGLSVGTLYATPTGELRVVVA